ncbi:MAG: baseplate J/gp47 family protein [Spirochaetes bacterium]|nr:baseplate J/gp47 family protein [Spirochaetota bacterium]
MIPSPNLDDRTFQDIVDEAKRLIPHYCPEWTNHNPTDPGIALIELFAWMTELLIYRLNKVPEKNYLAFLDLIGLSLTPPRAAKTLLTFTPAAGCTKEIFVKKGTQFSTEDGGDKMPLVFETANDLIINDNRLAAFFSILDGRITDNLELLDQKKSFYLFSGKDEISRFIYILDDSLKYLKNNNALNIEFVAYNEIKSIKDEIVNFLQWEYWNGRKWRVVEHLRSLNSHQKADNEIFVTGPLDIEETEVNGIKGYFLRSRLINLPERRGTFEIVRVQMKLIFQQEGILPDQCLENTANMVFNKIDLNKDFKLFNEIPKYNDCFYISSEEVFSKNDSEIQIKINISESDNQDLPEPGSDLVLKFEYWDGNNWNEIYNTTKSGVFVKSGDFDFLDTTSALSASGVISFLRPHDMQKCKINSFDNYWIRIRIFSGDFGSGGKYLESDDGKWNWYYEKPVRVPVLSNIRLKYISEKICCEKLLSFNDYNFMDLTLVNNNSFINRDDEIKNNYFTIMQIDCSKNPVSYLGFTRNFTRGNNAIYFRLAEKRYITSENKTNCIINENLSLKWEYWNGKKWVKLDVNNHNNNFNESGFIEFISPVDMKVKKEFGKELYWMRVIFESGSFASNPEIINIHLNSVYAYNHETHFNELLGSGSGMPGQEYDLINKPVLYGVEVCVKENEMPSEFEKNQIISEEGKQAVSDVDSDEKGVWIKYHCVESFNESKSYSRHFMVDYKNSKIIFGNGINGIIVPRLKNNIKILCYRSGGGVKGNIGSNKISILRENIPFINEVTNHYPAEGGADIESIENLKIRAGSVLKNIVRAVTKEDYETLAFLSESSVGKVKCLSKLSSKGEVVILILPKIKDNEDFFAVKSFPTTELLKIVKNYLEEKKVIGTKIVTEAFVYKEISIKINLALKGIISDFLETKDKIIKNIKDFFHPITGGVDRSGWPDDRDILKNDIFYILGKIDEISFIKEISFFECAINEKIEKVILKEDELIFIKEIEIIIEKNWN